MTCINAQKLMTGFINEELDIDTLELFLMHIRSCDSCREDLEVYYSLFAGMKLLDEDKNISMDYQVDFERKLKRAEETVHRARMRVIQKRIAILIIAILIAFLV